MPTSPSSALTIWSNVGFAEPVLGRLRDGARPHRLVFASVPTDSVLESGPPDPALREAEVIFGQPDPDALLSASRIRWVHLTTAGYTRYDRPDVRAAFTGRGATLTNSSHVHNEPCAQHALASLLAMSRRLPQAWINQSTVHGWPITELRAGSFLLEGQTVLLLGFGAIAERLAEMLGAFRLRILAFRRKPVAANGVELVTADRLVEALSLADHVIDLLPESESTRHFMSASRFRAMKPGAFFYNIGRGATVDQQALLDALRSGHVAAACLDVTDPEPLPPDHPLWTTPNCYITPHTAGGHSNEEQRLVEHFLQNLRAFERGEPLLGRVI